MITSTALADTYREQGYIIVRGLYSAAAIGEWKTEVLRLMAGFDDPTGVRVWMADNIPAYFRARFTESPIIDRVRDLLGPQIEFLSAKPVYKSGKVTFSSPWHQDYAYWHGTHKLSAWIALDPATIDNGCLRIVPGGHRAFLPHDQERTAVGFNNRLSEEAITALGLPVIDAPMDVGDALFFHDLLPHASHPNTSGRDRWSFIPTYRSTADVDPSQVWATTIPL